MNKGKIILQDISVPAKGMTVVWCEDIIENKPEVWVIKKIDGLAILYRDGKFRQAVLTELKQIMVKYRDFTNKQHNSSDKFWHTLPFHPDDNEKAIRLVGQEVEFEIVDGYTEPQKSYTGIPAKKSTVKWHIKQAKLSLPTQGERESKHNPRNKQVAYCYQLGDDLKVLTTLSAAPEKQATGIKNQIDLMRLHLLQLENTLPNE
jgi:hypothetical protein